MGILRSTNFLRATAAAAAAGILSGKGITDMTLRTTDIKALDSSAIIDFLAASPAVLAPDATAMAASVDEVEFSASHSLSVVRRSLPVVSR